MDFEDLRKAKAFHAYVLANHGPCVVARIRANVKMIDERLKKDKL